MTDNRRRRIARRLLRPLAFLILPPVAYIASAILLNFAHAVGLIPYSLLAGLVPAYAPLNAYVEAGYPGGGLIVWACESANAAGERLVGR